MIPPHMEIPTGQNPGRRLLILTLFAVGFPIVVLGGMLLWASGQSTAAEKLPKLAQLLGSQNTLCQRITHEILFFELASGEQKESLANQIRTDLNLFKTRHTEVTEVGRDAASALPQLVQPLSALEPKYTRFVNRVESIMGQPQGKTMTPEIRKSLYLLSSEFKSQSDELTGTVASRATAILDRTRRHLWVSFGATVIAAAAAAALILKPAIKTSSSENRELRLLNLQLEEAVAASKSAATSKAFFICHVAQRMRKIVSEIVEHAARLEKTLIDTKGGENADYAASIRNRAAPIVDVINDVLNLSLIESNLTPLMPRAVNLSRLLDDMTPHLKPRAEDKGLVYTLSRGDEPIWVLGDSDQIWRMIDKIFDNAVKYTEHGEVTITLSGRTEGRVTIAIRDTGRGIAPEQIETIFDPQSFEETTEEDSEEGLGINLSVAHQLAALMKSVISVHSEVDKGTTFLIDMPVCTESGNYPVQG